MNFILWRILIVFIGVYHLLVGVILFVSGDLAIEVAREYAGMIVKGSPELGIVGEILACYIIAFGLLMLAAAWNPVKNRVAISIGLALIGFRLFQRAMFSEKMMTVFGITESKYWLSFAIVTVIGLSLGFFRWTLYRHMR